MTQETLSDPIPGMSHATVCRGSFAVGTACGECQRCKAAAFDWLRENKDRRWWFAMMKPDVSDIMRAVMEQSRREM